MQYGILLPGHSNRHIHRKSWKGPHAQLPDYRAKGRATAQKNRLDWDAVDEVTARNLRHAKDLKSDPWMQDESVKERRCKRMVAGETSKVVAIFSGVLLQFHVNTFLIEKE